MADIRGNFIKKCQEVTTKKNIIIIKSYSLSRMCNRKVSPEFKVN